MQVEERLGETGHAQGSAKSRGLHYLGSRGPRQRVAPSNALISAATATSYENTPQSMEKKVAIVLHIEIMLVLNACALGDFDYCAISESL